MAEFREFNIFGRQPASFRQALPALAAASFRLPVADSAAGDLKARTLLPLTADPKAPLQAFAAPASPAGPFTECRPDETALLFFHAPERSEFRFTPAQGQAAVSATRAEVSLLAGLALAGNKAPADPAAAAAAEFAAGNLHQAHYFYDQAAAGPAGGAVRLPLCAALAELGLFQEAYDPLKNERAPEALLLLASVFRRTGDARRAAEALSAVPPGPLDAAKAEEAAWLLLAAGQDEQAEKEFARLTAAEPGRPEAWGGLGAALSKISLGSRSQAHLVRAAAAFDNALKKPSPGMARYYFQLGNVLFRAGSLAKAETAYAQAVQRSPGIQAQSNLAMVLMRAGRQRDAEALAVRIALTDPQSAARLSGRLGADRPAGGGRDFSERTMAAAPAPLPQQKLDFDNFPAPPPVPPQTQPGPAVQVSLEPATTRPPMMPELSARQQEPRLMPELSVRQPLQPAPLPPFGPAAEQPQAALAPAGLEPSPLPAMASLSAAFTPAFGGTDFLAGAFDLTSAIERETGKKVYFNRDGLNAVEERLRAVFAGGRSEAAFAAARQAAAFTCRLLQERHRGELQKLQGFEPWAWPMLFAHGAGKFTTYPAQRAWRLIREEKLPDRGWLGGYAEWIEETLRTGPAPLPCGAQAVRDKRPSHPERLADAGAEHGRMLQLALGLPELSGIEVSQAGLFRLEQALRKNFKPGVPPGADGWRLLRCCGHLLAAILAKELNAAWYNADGQDGGWSMRLQCGLFVFPLGKTYKAAAGGEDLAGYFAELLAEKRKYAD